MRASELNRWWAIVSAVTMPIVRLVFRVRVEGISNVPATGPAILVFNHVSVLDGPVLAIEVARRRRRESRFLVAAEVFHKVSFGWLLRSFDQIPIRRGEGDAEALDEAIETVTHGAIAAIAPEGRVNDEVEIGLQRIRRGAARLALPTGALVIPVGLWGTQSRWPRSGLRLGRPWRPWLAVVFGQGLVPHGDPRSPEDIDAFTDRVREALETQVARARGVAEAA
jgi:1-acyl-sn-glycerol-3-phosphate acyltransferase